MAQLASLNFLNADELALLDIALIRLADSDEKYWNNSQLWNLAGKVFNAAEALEDQQR